MFFSQDMCVVAKNSNQCEFFGSFAGSENTRDVLVDCTAAHLWQPKFASYGLGLRASSRRICLRGPAGKWLHLHPIGGGVASRHFYIIVADNSRFGFKWIYRMLLLCI